MLSMKGWRHSCLLAIAAIVGGVVMWWRGGGWEGWRCEGWGCIHFPLQWLDRGEFWTPHESHSPFLSFLSSIHLYLPSQASVLLLQCVHLLGVALLSLNKFMLHLGLSFKDGIKVNLVCVGIFGYQLNIFCNTNFSTGWNHLQQFSNCFGKILILAPRWTPIVLTKRSQTIKLARTLKVKY